MGSRQRLLVAIWKARWSPTLMELNTMPDVRRRLRLLMRGWTAGAEVEAEEARPRLTLCSVCCSLFVNTTVS